MSYAVYGLATGAAEAAASAATRLGGFAGHEQRLGTYPADLTARLAGGRVLWMHSASVGELLASRPLIARFREALADWRIVLSTTSFAGRDIARGFPEAEAAVLLPLDAPGAVERALDALRPSLFVFTETEIWPNLLRGLARRSVPAVLLSGRISERSFRRYLWVRSFLRGVLAQVARFGMQSEADAERIRALGAEPGRVRVTGSLKSEAPVESRPAIVLAPPGALWIAASTHAGEEEACLRAHARLQRSFPDLRLLLAPRHLPRLPEVEAVLRREGVRYALRSTLPDARWRGEEDVLVLDTLGELGGLYGGAAAAFVGGTLVPVGGHNLLEPARAGVAVLFGPHVENVAEIASRLAERGGGFRIADAGELADRIAALLGDRDAREHASRAAVDAVAATGALEANFRLAAELVP